MVEWEIYVNYIFKRIDTVLCNELHEIILVEEVEYDIRNSLDYSPMLIRYNTTTKSHIMHLCFLSFGYRKTPTRK